VVNVLTGRNALWPTQPNCGWAMAHPTNPMIWIPKGQERHTSHRLHIMRTRYITGGQFNGFWFFDS